MKLSTMKPGLLVSLKTSVTGGVQYFRHEIEKEHTDESGALVARWETSRNIPDPQEFEAAATARSKARSIVSAACCSSSFGLLCPSDQQDALEVAIREAQEVAAAHNRVAQRTHVEVYVLVGRIAQDDAEAVRAISAEIRELLDAMQAGIKAADPEAIRDAANKARALGGMLSENVSGKVSEAITEARKAAREIVKRVQKSGELAADVVKELSVQRIEGARFSFLDMEGGAVVEAEAPAARGLDLPAADATTEPAAALTEVQRELEV